MKKKILSFILSIALLAGMILSPLPAEAFDFSGSDREYKLSYTPKLMTEAEGTHPFRYDADGELKVATQMWERVTRQGYANITTYKAPEDGTFGVIDTYDESYVTISEVGAIVEFCIADNDGNILYPNNNNVITIDDNEKHTFNDIELNVKKGQEINFIFYGVKCDGTIGFDFIARMSFKNTTGTMTRIDNTYRLWPTSGVEQGSDNLYFKYAEDYTKVTNAGLDMSTGYQKKLSFTKQLMVPKIEHQNYYTFGMNGVWGAGSGKYAFGASATYDNIVTFKAPKAGVLQVKNMTVKLGASYATQTLGFAITDNEGNILYPTDKSIVTIGGDIQSQSSIALKYPIQEGEEINFVCFDANQETSITLMGELTIDGTTYSNAGYLWPTDLKDISNTSDTTEEVKNNHAQYQYYYSTDVVVNNIVKSEWEEFVEINKYDLAPNTIEAWVKISEEVADDKKGIIVSNGGTRGYANDITVEMGYNGKPHLYSASKDFDFTVNADLRTGEWTHLAFVNDQANNKMYCYINGELKGICNDSYDNTKIGIQCGYVIGNNRDYDKGSAFQGEMRDLRFWSDVRSKNEISNNQNAIVKGNEAGLLGAWSLNDYSSSKTYFPDKTVTTNHGQLVSPYNKFVQADAVKEYDYSMAVIGDTQYYTESDSGIQNFKNITSYLAEQGTDKIQHVMHVGDLTATNNAIIYERAQSAMNTLVENNIPHSIALGNHEYKGEGGTIRDSSMYNSYFTQAYFEKVNGNMGFYPEYYEVSSESTNVKWKVVDGETKADGEVLLSEIVNTRACESPDIVAGDYVALKADNNYRTFKAGNTDYLIITLEFNPRDEVVDWANTVVETHSEYKTIVLTHGYTDNGEVIATSPYFPQDTEGQNVSTSLWDKFVSKHENIFMLFCGHAHAPEITSNVMVGDNGNTVYQYMVAPTMGNGGDGVFLMMYFNEAKGVVDFRYYSPTEDKYWGYQNMLQIDLDNSNTNTDIVEITKPNIATDNILNSFGGAQLNTAGYWLINENDTTNDFYKVRFVQDGTVFTNDKSSIVRQYVVSNNGTAKILMYLHFPFINAATNTDGTSSIDIQIYNSKGENITSRFKTGADAAAAIAGSGTQYVPYDSERGTFNMINNGAHKGYIYAEIEGVKKGDSFYFVSTAHNMRSVGDAVTQQQTIYINSEIAHPNATTTTLNGVDGKWINSTTDFPTTSAVTDNAARQGHLGWYYKYVSNSVLRNYSYSAKKAQVDVNIVGDGSISTYTTSATYDAATGKITLPHDNSLFVDVKKSEGSVLSAVYWNDIPVAHTTSTDASIRVNVPCVGNGGTLTVIFKPTAESVTINGVSNYYDYGTQVLGDVNGTDGIDVRDLVRTVSHLEDSTVAIKAYNADINKDKKIDENDTSELRNILLQ